MRFSVVSIIASWRHFTRAMIRVQRSPQQKTPGDEPGILLCDDLQAH
jgi:hypothetical protein